MRRIIYKYRDFNDSNSLDILINGKFFLCDWQKLNDPCESKFVVFDGTKQFTTNPLLLKEMYQHYLPEMKFTFDDPKICAFSKTWKSSLMWSHYANGHKGFVIGIELENPINSPFILRDVEYSNLIPTFNLTDLDNSINDVLTEAVAHKSIDWKYEKEIRLITFSSETYYSSFKIKELIFGSKMPKPNKDVLINLVEGKGITTFQMLEKSNSYHISRTIYDPKTNYGWVNYQKPPN